MKLNQTDVSKLESMLGASLCKKIAAAIGTEDGVVVPEYVQYSESVEPASAGPDAAEPEADSTEEEAAEPEDSPEPEPAVAEPQGPVEQPEATPPADPEPPAEAEPEAPAVDDSLPGDMPGRDDLESAGIDTMTKLRAYIESGQKLESIKGIGPATASKIAAMI